MTNKNILIIQNVSANANISTVTCIKGNLVKLFRKVYNFEDIQCKHIVRGDVRATDEQCDSSGGKIYLIGYPPTRNDWVTLITVCYNNDVGQTLYTKHQISGKEIECEICFFVSTISSKLLIYFR